MNDYQKYIHVSKYARYRDSLGRRETWPETVDRYISFWQERNRMGTGIGDAIYDPSVLEEIRSAILNMEVMPSMRAMMTAGRALDRCNLAAYNCAAIAVDHPRVFDEVFYILLNGAGVGFSVERQFINKLPIIAENFYESDTTIVVGDSKEMWAKALKELIALLYNGDIPKWDMSAVRPAGARLKTFGGRACLTGDTILYKDRKKSRGYNEITIKDLYDMERSSGKWESKSNHFNDVKLRSLDEETGVFFRNKVVTVVANGLAPIYQIITENGYRIKATGNHRFMRETGEYDFVDNFNEGDLIAVNGSSERKSGTCVDCGSSISRRAIRCKTCFNIYQQKEDALMTTARQRKQCRTYKEECCEICGLIESGSEKRFERHHIDENPMHNDHVNLMYLCPTCHQRLHAKQRTFSDPYSHKYLSFDKIISIEYAGEEQVYDLQMQGPNHNFIANGFVSHNSGPEPLDLLFRKTVAIFKRAAGRRLNSLECHDLLCHIGDTVIIGGVRRSAMISMSNLTDDRLRRAKTGEFYLTEPQRVLANNSVMYTEKPDLDSFLGEFRSMYKSRAGERGMINQEALREKAISCGRDPEQYYLLNP